MVVAGMAEEMTNGLSRLVQCSFQKEDQSLAAGDTHRARQEEFARAEALQKAIEVCWSRA